jgi:hypothetical protein
MDAVINWLWQGAVVGAALSMMLFTLTRARANVRYVVCWAAALMVLVLPLLPFLQPAAAGRRRHQCPGQRSDRRAAAGLVDVDAPAARRGDALGRRQPSSASRQPSFAIRRARRRSRTFPVHLESRLPHWRRIRGEGRRATLVLSNSVTSAAVLGWGAP